MPEKNDFPVTFEKLKAILKPYEGKSCFNFKTVDEKLLEELEKFTKAGFKKFHNPEFLQKLTQG